MDNLYHSIKLEFTKSFEINPNMSVDNVSLNVYSIERSLQFYRDLLVFQLTEKASDDNVILSSIGSSNKRYLLHLNRVHRANKVNEGEHITIRQAGLYHLAILLPSRSNLANMFKHLAETSDQLYFVGPACIFATYLSTISRVQLMLTKVILDLESFKKLSFSSRLTKI